MTPVMFVEEPVLGDHAHVLPDLVNASGIPLALGERLFTRGEFLAPLQVGVAIVQPDISHAGGISGLRRIAALAEVYGAQLAPHCPLGPVALAASLQVAFTTPNFLIQEHSLGLHYHRGTELLDYVADPEPFRFHGGSLLRTDRPGLGVEVDEAAVRTAASSGGTRGGTRCGATRTARSRNGDRAAVGAGAGRVTGGRTSGDGVEGAGDDEAEEMGGWWQRAVTAVTVGHAKGLPDRNNQRCHPRARTTRSRSTHAAGCRRKQETPWTSAKRSGPSGW